jgi:hypothetical protein
MGNFIGMVSPCMHPNPTDEERRMAREFRRGFKSGKTFLKSILSLENPSISRDDLLLSCRE